MHQNSDRLKTYILPFVTLLKRIEGDKLLLDGYPKSYLDILLKNATYYVHIYAHALDALLSNTSKQKEEIVLIDYGAGNGLLGLFAKYLGFKKVYLVDVSENFIDASKQLSKLLSIDIDGFVVGDCGCLKDVFDDTKPDAIVGTDVIEHIYNLEEFFCCLKQLNGEMISVFTTASVTANFIKDRQLRKLQFNDEHKYSNAAHALAGDEYAGMPFKEIRRSIIQKAFPELDKDLIESLTRNTRGLNKTDVITAVESYLLTKKLPPILKHPTNTCDPITGSWTERLLSIDEYKNIYKKEGFTLQLRNGFYNEWQPGFKGASLKMANKTIALLGKQGNIITPFITLIGKS